MDLELFFERLRQIDRHRSPYDRGQRDPHALGGARAALDQLEDLRDRLSDHIAQWTEEIDAAEQVQQSRLEKAWADV